MPDGPSGVKNMLHIQFAGLGPAIVWVVASLWQQWGWFYVSPPAITCDFNQYPAYATWTIVATLVIVAASGVLYLWIGLRQAGPGRPGSIVLGVGLAISFLFGLAASLFQILLFTGLQGLGGPLPTAPHLVNEIFLLAVFVLPPIAGLCSVFIANSQAALERVGRVNRGRLAFGVAAGVTLLAPIAAYLVVGANCANSL